MNKNKEQYADLMNELNFEDGSVGIEKYGL